jgi:hypothetical protein
MRFSRLIFLSSDVSFSSMPTKAKRGRTSSTVDVLPLEKKQKTDDEVMDSSSVTARQPPPDPVPSQWLTAVSEALREFMLPVLLNMIIEYGPRDVLMRSMADLQHHPAVYCDGHSFGSSSNVLDRPDSGARGTQYLGFHGSHAISSITPGWQIDSDAISENSVCYFGVCLALSDMINFENRASVYLHDDEGRRTDIGLLTTACVRITGTGRASMQDDGCSFYEFANLRVSCRFTVQFQVRREEFIFGIWCRLKSDFDHWTTWQKLYDSSTTPNRPGLALSLYKGIVDGRVVPYAAFRRRRDSLVHRFAVSPLFVFDNNV